MDFSAPSIPFDVFQLGSHALSIVHVSECVGVGLDQSIVLLAVLHTISQFHASSPFLS